MAKKRLKPLLPSLREKKRYIAYELVAEEKFQVEDVHTAVRNVSKEFLGTLGAAKAGILPMDDQFNYQKQKGIIRVNNKHTDNLRASMVFVQTINSKNVIMRSIGASGILKKTKEQYVN